MSRSQRCVLHLIDTGGPGGAETIFLDLVRGLGERGWRCIPVVPERDWLYEEVTASGFEALELHALRAFDIAYLHRLRKVIREQRVDVVQTHLLGSSVYGTLACLGTGVPVVSTFHGRPDIPETDRLRALKTRILRRSDNRVVCVSESLREYFVRRGHLDEQARVIPNGVELASSRTPAASNLRETLHLAPTTPLLGAIGNVRASKGYHVLLEAFATVRATIPEARLVIAGQYHGSLGDHLLELRARLGLDDAVTFLGFRDDVREILEAIDVFVLSSLDEGFSLATVQAMASAVPVIATRSGGPEEIIGDSKAAVLVEPGDATSLARAVIELLTDREQARALGAAARRRVEGRYSLERMLGAYEELYREALSARSSPSLRHATKTSSRMLR